MEDTGLAVINSDIFAGMPDEALVNLWLMALPKLKMIVGIGMF